MMLFQTQYFKCTISTVCIFLQFKYKPSVLHCTKSHDDIYFLYLLNTIYVVKHPPPPKKHTFGVRNDRETKIGLVILVSWKEAFVDLIAVEENCPPSSNVPVKILGQIA